MDISKLSECQWESYILNGKGLCSDRPLPEHQVRRLVQIFDLASGDILHRGVDGESEPDIHLMTHHLSRPHILATWALEG